MRKYAASYDFGTKQINYLLILAWIIRHDNPVRKVPISYSLHYLHVEVYLINRTSRMQSSNTYLLEIFIFTITQKNI